MIINPIHSPFGLSGRKIEYKPVAMDTKTVENNASGMTYPILETWYM
jgi:hypothetical protein